MYIPRLGFFLIPVLLSVTEAVLRSIYLRDISPRVNNKRDLYIDRHTSCAMKAFQSFKGYSNITKMLLDTSSCSLVETLNAQKSSEETSLWEIWKYRELQTNEIYMEDSGLIISNSTTTTSARLDQLMVRVIFTFNVDEQTFEIISPKYHIHKSLNIILKVKDAVYCPGGEKPLKLVSPNSDVYSFTFPELYKQGIFSWKARYKIGLDFLRCDTTSGTILPISYKNIFYGTWAGNNPNISCLTTVPRRILNVAVEMFTKTLYWTQKSADNDENMELYRIHYNGLGKKKMVTILEAFTAFAIDPFQQSIYVCTGVLARFTMQGILVQTLSSSSETKCSAVALYNNDLYVHTTNSDGILVHINSNKSSEEFPVKHRCSILCVTQVFEAPYKSMFPEY